MLTGGRDSGGRAIGGGPPAGHGASQAVRAVDTATHPDYQGRGICKRLTTSSLEALREQGVTHVFNTPNEQSRPGYLKMAWEQVGKLPVGVRFRSPVSAVSALRARVPADKWSLPTDVASSVEDVLADDVEVLRWRYGFGPLHYRGVRGHGGIRLFRLRKRGPVPGRPLPGSCHPRASVRVRWPGWRSK